MVIGFDIVPDLLIVSVPYHESPLLKKQVSPADKLGKKLLNFDIVAHDVAGEVPAAPSLPALEKYLFAAFESVGNNNIIIYFFNILISPYFQNCRSSYFACWCR